MIVYLTDSDDMKRRSGLARGSTVVHPEIMFSFVLCARFPHMFQNNDLTTLKREEYATGDDALVGLDEPEVAFAAVV